jgi:hypothetical protein
VLRGTGFPIHCGPFAAFCVTVNDNLEQQIHVRKNDIVGLCFDVRPVESGPTLGNVFAYQSFQFGWQVWRVRGSKEIVDI